MKIFKVILAMVMAGAILTNSRLAEAAITTSDFSTSDGGATYTGGGSGSQVIPDNTPAGAGYSINFGDTGVSIGNISVTLNLSGGYDGDIYAYLSHGNQSVVLLNQITGAATSSGFNVTLIEGTANSIQTAPGTAGQPLTGPMYSANQDLVSFNNTDPNGTWTIFFADLGAGDTSTLNSFSVSLDAVPEPGTWGAISGAGLLGLCGVRAWRQRRQQNAAV
jgi:subtilisin-like proprotein convertase family protein